MTADDGGSAWFVWRAQRAHASGPWRCRPAPATRAVSLPTVAPAAARVAAVARVAAAGPAAPRAVAPAGAAEPAAVELTVGATAAEAGGAGNRTSQRSAWPTTWETLSIAARSPRTPIRCKVERS